MNGPSAGAPSLLFRAPGQPPLAIDSAHVPPPDQLRETERFIRHVRVDLDYGGTPDRALYNVWYDSAPNSAVVLDKRVPCNALWSPGAIGLLLSGQSSNALTKEHVVPYNIQLAYLLQGIRDGRSDVELAQLMVWFPDAVITTDEDKFLGNRPDLGVNLKTHMPIPEPGEAIWTEHELGGFVRHKAGGLDPETYLPAAEWTQVLMAKGRIEKPLAPRPNPASRPAHEIVPPAMLAANPEYSAFKANLSLDDKIKTAENDREPAPTVVPPRPMKVDDPARASLMSAMDRFEVENIGREDVQLG